MVNTRRTYRLNSLLKEVISEVIHKDVRHPKLCSLTSVTSVEITKDLALAKVFVSVIGTDLEKQETLKALESAAGYIAVLSSKKVVLKHFPALIFKLDDGVDKHLRIDSILKELEQKKHDKELNISHDDE